MQYVAFLPFFFFQLENQVKFFAKAKSDEILSRNLHFIHDIKIQDKLYLLKKNKETRIIS